MNHLFLQVQLVIFWNVFFSHCRMNVIYLLVLGEGEGMLVLQETCFDVETKSPINGNCFSLEFYKTYIHFGLCFDCTWELSFPLTAYCCDKVKPLEMAERLRFLYLTALSCLGDILQHSIYESATFFSFGVLMSENTNKYFGPDKLKLSTMEQKAKIYKYFFNQWTVW